MLQSLFDCFRQWPFTSPSPQWLVKLHFEKCIFFYCLFFFPFPSPSPPYPFLFLEISVSKGIIKDFCQASDSSNCWTVVFRFLFFSSRRSNSLVSSSSRIFFFFRFLAQASLFLLLLFSSLLTTDASNGWKRLVGELVEEEEDGNEMDEAKSEEDEDCEGFVSWSKSDECFSSSSWPSVITSNVFGPVWRSCNGGAEEERLSMGEGGGWTFWGILGDIADVREAVGWVFERTEVG